MFAPDPLTFAYRTEAFTGNPTLTPGVTVTPGVSDADGTAVALIGTALTHDVEQLEIYIHCATVNAQTGVDTSSIIDILIDPAGGTTWDTTNLLIEGLMAGYLNAATAIVASYRRWRFPLWIPAGATLAARGASHAASGNVAVVVNAIAKGGVNNPQDYWCGQKVDAIGINRAASGGTSVAPNASANTYGSWTSIGGATGRRYGALIPSACCLGAAVTNGNRQMQIGISSLAVSPAYHYATNSVEVAIDIVEDKLCPIDVPEGTQLQARQRSGGASASADQIIIHGVA